MNPATNRQEPASQPTPKRNSVERAFLVLQTIVADGEPVGVREISRRTGLPRSTVSRLATTLKALGMVKRQADGALSSGPALRTLSPARGEGAVLLHDHLRPLLTELASVFSENAALSIDDGERLLYLVQVEADQAVTVPDLDGSRHHFHLVAPGLVTMAHWDEDRLNRYLTTALETATPASVVDPDRIRRRLGQIMAQGYAWTDQELDEGVNGLAVPIIDDSGLLATISLYGPSYRFAPDHLVDAGDELVRTVDGRARTLLGLSSASEQIELFADVQSPPLGPPPQAT